MLLRFHLVAQREILPIGGEEQGIRHCAHYSCFLLTNVVVSILCRPLTLQSYRCPNAQTYSSAFISRFPANVLLTGPALFAGPVQQIVSLCSLYYHLLLALNESYAVVIFYNFECISRGECVNAGVVY